MDFLQRLRHHRNLEQLGYVIREGVLQPGQAAEELLREHGLLGGG